MKNGIVNFIIFSLPGFQAMLSKCHDYIDIWLFFFAFTMVCLLMAGTQCRHAYIVTETLWHFILASIPHLHLYLVASILFMGPIFSSLVLSLSHQEEQTFFLLEQQVELSWLCICLWFVLFLSFWYYEHSIVFFFPNIGAIHFFPKTETISQVCT